MENLSRNIRKKLNLSEPPKLKFTRPKPSKQAGDRVLLVVEPDGEIKKISWFRFQLFRGLLIIALLTAGFLFFLYQNQIKENRYLPDILNVLKKEAASFQTTNSTENSAEEPLSGSEKSETPIQKEPPRVQTEEEPEKTENSSVLVSEASGSEAHDPKPAAPDDITETEAMVTDFPESETVEMPSPETDSIVKPSSETETETSQTETVSEPMEVKTPPRVAIENFEASYRESNRTLHLRFLVRNMTSGSVSGHVVVVLKSNQMSQKNWVALPSVTLISGRPSGEETGESFNISNYKPVRLESKLRIDPNRFQTATVFVFSAEGVLLSENDFVLEIKEI